MRTKAIIVIILFVIRFVSAQNNNEIYKLTYKGSSTVGNFIYDASSQQQNIQFHIDTKPESSGGELAILEGRTDLAGIARLPSKEVLSSGVTSSLIGWDAIAIIVHKDNPIKNLTQSQLKEIYTGTIKNWKELGGNDIPISSYIVSPESATRKVCRSIILGAEDYKDGIEVRPDSDIINRVQNDPGGIGQISFSFLKEKSSIHILHINGQALTLTNKNYPIVRPLYLLWWQGRRDVANFVQWALSNEGQRVVMKSFIGVKEATVKIEEAQGELIVYTKTSPIEDGGIYFYPHDMYAILDIDHNLIMNVQNHLSNNDENPTRIALPIGKYIIQTDIHKGKIQEFSLSIVGGKLVKLYPERKTNTQNNYQLPSNSANKIKVHGTTKKKYDFFGDFRVRTEQDYRDNYNRFRGRFRIRTGLYASLSNQFKLEFRLVSTGDSDDPNSSHVNLTNGFNQIKVAFDKAFIHYTPSSTNGVEWWLGKFSNPNVSSKIYSEILWDADIQPEGTAIAWNKNFKNGGGNIKFVSGAYLLSQFKSGNTKNWLYSGQVSSKVKLLEQLSLHMASGIYYYNDIKDLDISASFIDGNDGNLSYKQYNVSQTDTTITQHYSSDFHILDNFIYLKTNKFNTPLIAKVQWIYNLGAKNNNVGISTGLSFGELKNKNDWLFYYQYNKIEQDAIFTPFAQDDALQRSNTSSHILGVAYSIQKKISVHLWGLANELDGNHYDTRVRLDLNVKI